MPRGIKKDGTSFGFKKGNTFGNRFEKGNQLGKQNKGKSWGKHTGKTKQRLRTLQRAYHRKKICLICNNIFNNQNSKYCSRDCYFKAYSKNKTGTHQPQWIKDKIKQGVINWYDMMGRKTPVKMKKEYFIDESFLTFDDPDVSFDDIVL